MVESTGQAHLVAAGEAEGGQDCGSLLLGGGALLVVSAVQVHLAGRAGHLPGETATKGSAPGRPSVQLSAFGAIAEELAVRSTLRRWQRDFQPVDRVQPGGSAWEVHLEQVSQASRAAECLCASLACMSKARRT